MKPKKTPEITQPETNAHGIPITERLAILASATSALAMDLGEGYEDSIPTWPSVSVPSRAPAPHDALKLRLANQVLCGNGPTRLARVIKGRTPIDKNPWIRSGWILQNWFAFKRADDPAEDSGMNMNFDDLGLCCFTDETAAAIIESRFDMGEFSRKQFTDFRKKYKLAQVSKEHRRSGIIRNGDLIVQRIGRKAI